MKTLREAYEECGLTTKQWHVGPEHPHLENFAIKLLRAMPRARVLEIGYQAGGFAVPVIVQMQERFDFVYVGVDAVAYSNSVPGDIIQKYLESEQVTGAYTFHVSDSHAFLRRLSGQFDLILIDHYKPLYPREFYTLIKRQLIAPDGVVLFHDVLDRAESAWVVCKEMCELYGFATQIVDDVPGGLAVARRTRQEVRGHRLARAMLGVRIATSNAKRALYECARKMYRYCRHHNRGKVTADSAGAVGRPGSCDAEEVRRK